MFGNSTGKQQREKTQKDLQIKRKCIALIFFFPVSCRFKPIDIYLSIYIYFLFSFSYVSSKNIQNHTHKKFEFFFVIWMNEDENLKRVTLIFKKKKKKTYLKYFSSILCRKITHNNSHTNQFIRLFNIIYFIICH